ncbi:MAG: Endoglucanase precursor [Firmicutes bacterium ADurb.Bin193]|nr:MAG: Endoglucanase precursor [Firmicutes bacterium ADurb.Bin193]
MRKKVLSCVMAVCILLGGISAYASETAASGSLIDGLVGLLLTYSPEDRHTAVLLLKSYLLDDAYIDLIAAEIRAYDPKDESSLLGDYIGKVLKYVDKDTAARSLEALKVIDESIRDKYIDVYTKKQGLSVSNSVQKDMESLLEILYGKHPGVRTLFEQDGITPRVAANMLGILVDINDGKPCLTDGPSGSDGFAVSTISGKFAAKADPVLAGLGKKSINVLAQEAVDNINRDYTEPQKAALKRVGAAVGFYSPAAQATPGKPNVSDAGTVDVEIPGVENTQIRYSVVDPTQVNVNIDLTNTTIVEIALFAGGEKQAYAPLGKEISVKIPVAASNIMVYKLSDTLIPVKYNVYADNQVLMRIDATGYYAIKSEDVYFSDVTGWGSFYVEALYRRGIVSGVGMNVFDPEGNVKREELVKLVVELMGITSDGSEIPFTDVPKDAWSFKYIASAYQSRLINGIAQDRFGTGEFITRQDLCKIIYSLIHMKNMDGAYLRESASFEDAAQISSYAFQSVDALYRLNIVSGDEEGRFNPQNYATRQEAAKIIYGVLALYVNQSDLAK